MSNHEKNIIEYDDEKQKYQPHDLNQKSDVFKKISHTKQVTIISAFVHVGVCALFLILLLVDWIIGGKLGFKFTGLQFGLSLGYICLVALIDILVFILLARKINKRSHFKFMIFLTLILATLIFSGSLAFWAVPALLFYSLITLAIWIIYIFVAKSFFSITEKLPN